MLKFMKWKAKAPNCSSLWHSIVFISSLFLSANITWVYIFTKYLLFYYWRATFHFIFSIAIEWIYFITLSAAFLSLFFLKPDLFFYDLFFIVTERIFFTFSKGSSPCCLCVPLHCVSLSVSVYPSVFLFPGVSFFVVLLSVSLSSSSLK